jgi:uncharacterized protein YndB with AHSA1/START domain
MPTTVADRIEKRVVLRAPRSRVWRALANSDEFGSWFGVKMDAPFAPGANVHGRITHPGFEHLTFEVCIERVEPEHYLAWRWHPYPSDPNQDYSNEPTTLVEFRLEETGSGTELTVIESGFSRIPLHRRDEAFRMNEGGWTEQMGNLERHVTQS